MRRRLLSIGLAAAVLAAAAGATVWAVSMDRYRVSVVLRSATNLLEGGVVTLKGFKVGQIDDISVEQGRARIKLAIEGDAAPLHDGAQVRVEWKALLGERWIAIEDGKSTNPPIPDGGTIPGRQLQPMELDQVLNALDKRTRKRLSSLVSRLENTVDGNEQDITKALRSAGPALHRLAQVLKGLGTDGQAIKDLVTQLNDMISTLAKRDGDVAHIVNELTEATSNVVGKRQQLSAALKRLPQTLATAKATLGDVPETTKAVIPLMEDLRPVTDKLRATAGQLARVLRDLEPTVDELGPTLRAARKLLNYTPGLLDSAKATLPGITTTANYLNPVLNYLRPYTPEVAGWMSAWASDAANYDSNGHFVRIYPSAGLAGAVRENPGVRPPGLESNPYPRPGANVNQAWTDAWGSGVN